MSSERENVQKPSEVWEAEREKLEAEAEEARANAQLSAMEAAKMAAEIEESKATVRLTSAEARKAEAEADEAEMATTKTKLETDKLVYERQMLMAQDEFHHAYIFDEEVRHDSVKKCMEKLRAWHRNSPGCAMEIWFNSPGGSVISGMHLFDYIRMLRKEGHPVTTGATGYAASMAGILLQAGEPRVMGREAYMLIHEVAAGAIGKMGELEDEMAFLRKMQKRIIGIFAERSKLSAATIERKWKRKDWWLDSEEALKYGFVDEVR